MAVEASIIVEFGEGAEDSNVAIEIDDAFITNLDREGNLKSTFHPTDNPVFLIHHGSDVQVASVSSTDGELEKIGINQLRIRETGALFTTPFVLATEDDNTVSTGYVDIVIDEVVCYGNQGSVYSDKGDIKSSSGKIPFYCDIDFSVLFNEQWRLFPPDLELDDDETYIIYVVIYVDKVTT